jgi:hypothetical protein
MIACPTPDGIDRPRKHRRRGPADQCAVRCRELRHWKRLDGGEIHAVVMRNGILLLALGAEVSEVPRRISHGIRHGPHREARPRPQDLRGTLPCPAAGNTRANAAKRLSRLERG